MNNTYERKNGIYSSGQGRDIIDVKETLTEWMKMALRFWYFCAIGCILGGVFGYFIGNLLYVPKYTSYASAVVRQGFAGEDSTEDKIVAELDAATQVELTEQLAVIAQLSKVSVTTDNSSIATSLSYIMNSTVMKTIIAEQLEVENLTSTIAVDTLDQTNLIMIEVTDSNPVVAQEVLSTLLTSYQNIAEYIVGLTQLTIIENSDIAIEPNNQSSVLQNIIIGICYGIGIYLVVLLSMILGRKTVNRGEDILEMKEIKQLGSIPHFGKKKKLQNIDEEMNYQSRNIEEANSSLANHLIRDRKQEGNQVYLFTSTYSGEGKSTVSLHTALVLIKKKYRVLLVDGDLYNSSLCKALGKEDKKGLGDVIQGKCKTKEAISLYKNTQLHCILGNRGKRKDDPYQLLSGEHMKDLLLEWKRDYDYIIIDTPPIAALADASLLATLADKSIIVFRQNQVHKLEALRTIERLEHSGVDLLGFVMNGVRYADAKYGYGYNKKYGYGYQNYYGVVRHFI